MTPKALWTGSGWRGYSYGGFGGGHPNFYRVCHLPTLQHSSLEIWDYQLGIRAVQPATPLYLQDWLSVRDSERPPVTEVNGPLMARCYELAETIARMIIGSLMLSVIGCTVKG